MYNKIGIIGVGFVGNAIKNAFIKSPVGNIVLIDTNTNIATGTYNDLHDAAAVFVCVPSPQGEDGTCDTSILESVLEKLVDFKGVIISKVTAPPSTYERLSFKYKNLVYVPEFLTASNASEDYALGSFCIIGGPIAAYKDEAERIIRISQHFLKHIVHCEIGEASFVKYSINTFLATKVIFMNELASLADKHRYDWNKLSSMINLDIRIGNTHMMVPGPDGRFGFGGMCFPKDTMALKNFANDSGAEMCVLSAAISKNKRIRDNV